MISKISWVNLESLRNAKQIIQIITMNLICEMKSKVSHMNLETSRICQIWESKSLLKLVSSSINWRKRKGKSLIIMPLKVLKANQIIELMIIIIPWWLLIRRFSARSSIKQPQSIQRWQNLMWKWWKASSRKLKCWTSWSHIVILKSWADVMTIETLLVNGLMGFSWPYTSAKFAIASKWTSSSQRFKSWRISGIPIWKCILA